MSARPVPLTAVVGLAGCALAVYLIAALPDATRSRLPGAAGGDETFRVTARFHDALDLVPNSTVRVADVPVGRVTGIEVTRDSSSYVAEATLEVDDSVDLPSNTVASISSTSLLGEKFVALVPPAHGTGDLSKTGSIPLERTSEDVQVEQLLSSLGALLNGGGLQQLATITDEFSTALDGNEENTRELLGRLDRIVNQLDRGRPALVAALHSTARLSRMLADQDDVIARSIRKLDPATGVLATQVDSLRTALGKLNRLSGRATGVIERSADDTVADLRALSPVLQEVGKVADQLPRNLTLLVTYPFADTAVPAFSGVYGAFKGSLVINLQQLLGTIAPVPSEPDEPFDPSGRQTSPLNGLAEGIQDGLTDGLKGLKDGPGRKDAPQLGTPDVFGGLDSLLRPGQGGER